MDKTLSLSISISLLVSNVGFSKDAEPSFPGSNGLFQTAETSEPSFPGSNGLFA